MNAIRTYRCGACGQAISMYGRMRQTVNGEERTVGKCCAAPRADMTLNQRVRVQRTARNQVSMDCTCGGASIVDHTYAQPTLDGHMGTTTRRRACMACGKTWQTVEMDAQELKSLRTAAAMHFLQLSPRADK